MRKSVSEMYQGIEIPEATIFEENAIKNIPQIIQKSNR